MKSLVRIPALLATAALALSISAAPAGAGVRFNVDVLWNPDPGDSSQVFLHVSNVVYPMPRERVTTVFYDIGDPYGDYPMLAFIAYHAHVDIGTVWAYKKKGHTWVNVYFHFGLKPSLLFADLPRPPGPPYGKAYGHWKKHGNRMGPDQLTGDDIRYWVRMRVVSQYGGVPARQVFDERESGREFDTIAVRQYREKNKKVTASGDGPGKGWGKGNAKGHDKQD